MDYLDFVLEIGNGSGREYPVAVIRSPKQGKVRATMHFPFDEPTLKIHLLALENALLRSGGKRRKKPPKEQKAVQDFGQQLFEALFTGAIRRRYELSLAEAERSDIGLRLKLRIQAPELAALPWEFLYDPARDAYLCRSANTPIIRYPESALRTKKPLAVSLPLRILGMIASPNDQEALDVQQEKQRLEKALSGLRSRGLVRLEWLPGQTWRDLQRAMRTGPWHVFHFIGHGGFNPETDEGYIVLADEHGASRPLNATGVGLLLTDHRPLRLVLLNACEGARGSAHDIFSSAAAILLRAGIPAVVAMQYEISDRAAIEFAHAFYEAMAEGQPVDAAVADARKSVTLELPNTVEWGTPVLYMRSLDGVLFNIAEQTTAAKQVEAKAVKTAKPAQGRPKQPAIAAKAAALQAQAQAKQVEEARRERQAKKKEAERAKQIQAEAEARKEAERKAQQAAQRSQPVYTPRRTNINEFSWLPTSLQDWSTTPPSGDASPLPAAEDNPLLQGWPPTRRASLLPAAANNPLTRFLLSSQTEVNSPPLAPPTAEDYFRRGKELKVQGDYKQAIAEFDEAIKLDPNRSVYHYWRGITDTWLDDRDRAIVDFSRAIQLEPKEAEYYGSRGKEYMWKGNYERAHQDFEDAQRLDDKNADYRYWQGLAYVRQRQYIPAVAVLTIAIFLNASQARYFFERGMAYHLQQSYDKAIEDFSEAVRLDAKLDNAYYWRGWAYKHKGDRIGARIDFKQAADLGHAEAKTELEKL